MDSLSRLYDTLSSIHWSFKFLEESTCPKNLLEALTQRLPHIPHSSWAERFAWGGVFLNGRAAKVNAQLKAPCHVEYFEPKFEIAQAQKFFPEFRSDYVVYEDEDLLVVYKPAGLPCLPNREQSRFHLKGYLNDYLKKSGAAPTVHLPSRLDASVGGLLAVSKSVRMHRALQQAFEKRTISKIYALEVEGSLKSEDVLVEKPIGRDERHPILRKIDEANGKSASTKFYRAREEKMKGVGAANRNLLYAFPSTGRTHQIRVHAAFLNCPIVGDNFYGGAQASELRLLSYGLRFSQPFSGVGLEIYIPPALEPEWFMAHKRLAPPPHAP